MNQYKILSILGSGAFGDVVKAQHMVSGEIFAIKKIKKGFGSWDECLKLREVASLTKLKKHHNIVRLKQLILEKGELFFVFEYCETNLLRVLVAETLEEGQVRDFMKQLLQGLAYVHKHGYFHRDVKPENLLIDKGVVKIADFGQARETRSRPPYTDYVATRWYRAPELLFGVTHYNSPIDMWAAGCIMAEMYLRQPLFPGTSEISQIHLLCQFVGTSNIAKWKEGMRAANKANFRLPKCSPKPLADVIPGASPLALSLIRELLHVDPNRRPTAKAALSHKFFTKASSKSGASGATKTPPKLRRNSLRVAPIGDCDDLTPVVESPTLTTWPKRRSTSAGSERDLSALLGEVLSPSTGSAAFAAALGGGGAGGGAGAAGAAGSGSKAAAAPSLAIIGRDVSLDADAMNNLIDEIEQEVCGGGK